MSNQIQIFTFNSSIQVRSLLIDNEPWFFAQDVASILKYSATSAMLKRLDDDEKQIVVALLQNGTTKQKQSVINESGMYNAIFGSTLSEAKAFRRWVTHEVLPSIRKRGYYADPDIVPNHDFTGFEPVSSSQYEEIARYIWKLSHLMHYKDSTSRALWHVVRSSLGIATSGSTIPAIYFEQAMNVVKQHEPCINKFFNEHADKERALISDIRHGRCLHVGFDNQLALSYS